MADWAPHLERALVLAREAGARDEVPVGCVIVKDGVVIAEASNAREERRDPTGHAEMDAIRAASLRLGSWRLEGCALVCTLEPCLMCLATAQQARVTRIVYASADPKGGALSLGYGFHSDGRLNHRFEVERVPDERADELLREFFRAKRGKGAS